MFEELLKRIAVELEGRKIPYMVIGGQAVLLYGEPRLTRDIDITLGLGPEDAEKVISLAKALRLSLLVPDPEAFLRKTLVLPTEEDASGIRVDFICSQTPYERQAMERAEEVKLGEAFVRFAALEDVIIHKVIAKRPRDIEDIKAMIAKNPSYDGSYIRTWLREFDAALGEEFSSVFELIVKELG